MRIMIFSQICFFLLCLKILVKGETEDTVGNEMCSSLTNGLGCLIKGQRTYRLKCQVLFRMCEAIRDGACLQGLKRNSPKSHGTLNKKSCSKGSVQDNVNTSENHLVLFYLHYPMPRDSLVYEVNSGQVKTFIRCPARLTALTYIKSERKFLASTDSRILSCVGMPCNFSVLIQPMATNSLAVSVSDKKSLVFLFSTFLGKIQIKNREKIMLVRMTTNGDGVRRVKMLYGQLHSPSIVVDSVEEVLYFAIGGNSIGRYNFGGILLGYITYGHDEMVLSLYNNEKGMHLYYRRNRCLFKWSSTNGSEKMYPVPASYAVEIDGKLFFTFSNNVYESQSNRCFRKLKCLYVAHKNIGIIGLQ